MEMEIIFFLNEFKIWIKPIIDSQWNNTDVNKVLRSQMHIKLPVYEYQHQLWKHLL